MKLSLLVILLLAVGVFGRNPSQTLTESPPLTVSNNTKMKKMEQETIIQASQIKTINESSELVLENEEIKNTVPYAITATRGATPQEQPKQYPTNRLGLKHCQTSMLPSLAGSPLYPM